MPHPVPAHIKAAVKKQATPIHYIKGKDGKGRACFHVVICPHARLREMQSAKTHVKPEDYGYLVAKGFGVIDETTRIHILNEYQFDIIP